VWHEDALLHGISLDLILPDRQPQLEPELFEVLEAVKLSGIAPLDIIAKGYRGLIRMPEELAEVIQPHLPAERIGQRRGQQSMIPARGDPAERTGGVATQAIGHEPLTDQQTLGLNKAHWLRRSYDHDTSLLVCERGVALYSQGLLRVAAYACEGAIRFHPDSPASFILYRSFGAGILT
jgi:hypothetical protein